MSTYSSDLRIELIANGAQPGTWGTTTNDTLAYVIDPSITGFQTVAVASANQALTYVSGSTATASANQAIYASLAFTTGLGTSFNIYAPPNPKQYIIWNNSSQSMTLYNSSVIGNTTPAGTGVTIPAGNKIQVFSDGTNFYSVEAANLTGTLAVINGGTGSTTASGARTNLSVPSTTGSGASGTWSISINGNAATATSATSATNATNATNVVSGGTIASDVTATTQSPGDNSTKVATTAFVLANPAAPTTAQVNSAISGSSAQAVGTYCFAVFYRVAAGFLSLTNGSNYASDANTILGNGYNAYVCGTASTFYLGTLPGTWKYLGASGLSVSQSQVYGFVMLRVA
jgi:hypothetical protein